MWVFLNIVARIDITIPLVFYSLFIFLLYLLKSKKISMCLETGHIDNMPKAKEKSNCRHLYGKEENFN